MHFAEYLADVASLERDMRFCSIGDADRAAIRAAAAGVLLDGPLCARIGRVASAMAGSDAEWRASPWRELVPDPQSPTPPPPQTAFALALPVLFHVSGARAAYAARSIPECILAETMRDLPRWIDTYFERTGGRFRGFAEISWLREHVSLRLFTLGRLQFQPGAVEDGAASFFHGARPGDPAINVHIPSGEPLSPQLCRQSFDAAPRFFLKYFPDWPVAGAKVFQCSSWLFAEPLLKRLPEKSNIRAFAGFFTCGLPHGDGSEAFGRVFPAKGAAATRADAKTSLQRTLLDISDAGECPQARLGLAPVAACAPRKLRLGVLGSGSGSNMQSIQDAIDAGTLDAEIAVVLTDVPGAKILDRAARHGIPASWVDHAPFKTKLEGSAEDEVIRILTEAMVDVVVLAGYMRVVKPKLLAAFPNRVINIHPALLPAFPGIAGWKQALDYGAKVAGCTVHFVNAGIDSGPIIVQKAVPVEDSDSPESLHARIQVQEHIAYPEALRLLASGRLLICGRKVVAL